MVTTKSYAARRAVWGSVVWCDVGERGDEGEGRGCRELVIERMSGKVVAV